MRLIDADGLIQFLKKVTVTDGITFETGFKQIITDIQNQPTAYDIDAVVEQVNRRTVKHYYKDSVYHLVYAEHAIYAIKRGGTEYCAKLYEEEMRTDK